MIVPLLVAIWFGSKARRAGRNAFGWALLGALIVFLITTVLVNVGALLLGPFSINTYIVFRVITAVLGITISVMVGRALLPPLQTDGGVTGKQSFEETS